MAFLIVGLGNIGAEYVCTRHNVGFEVLDAWAKESGAVFSNMRYGAVAETMLKGRCFMLLKPSTYMNLSGKAINYWMQAERFTPEELLVIVDDLALPFGSIRIRKQGSDGGHNGLKNINELLEHHQYARLRIGIGSNFPTGRQADFVLSKWTYQEQQALPAVLDKAVKAAQHFGLMGIDRTMTLFNK